MKMKHGVLSLLVMMCFSDAVTADAGHEKMSGDHRKSTMPLGHWMAPEKDAKRPNPIPADKASRARGKQLYQANCASCHGATGRGDGPAGKALRPKPANLVAMAGGHSDGDYAWKIENGRGPMPGWKSVLTQNQIWDVVNYVQSLGGSKTKAK